MSGIDIERTTLLERLKQHTLEWEGQQMNTSIRELNYTLMEWVNKNEKSIRELNDTQTEWNKHRTNNSA